MFFFDLLGWSFLDGPLIISVICGNTMKTTLRTKDALMFLAPADISFMLLDVLNVLNRTTLSAPFLTDPG